MWFELRLRDCWVFGQRPAVFLYTREDAGAQNSMRCRSGWAGGSNDAPDGRNVAMPARLTGFFLR